MDEPRQEGNTFIYDNVTDEDLHGLIDEGVITIADYLELCRHGKLEKDNIQIYFPKK
jgi:hypothetical protein